MCSLLFRVSPIFGTEANNYVTSQNSTLNGLRILHKEANIFIVTMLLSQDFFITSNKTAFLVRYSLEELHHLSPKYT